MFERWVLQDVEICGMTLPKGAELALLLGSANRDPAAFDRPGTLDLTRPADPHLASGPALTAASAHPWHGWSSRSPPARSPTGSPGQLAAEPRWRPAYVIRGLETLRVI